ncbi:hypothetical protein ACLOJK_036779 [Asimina triloba]
MSLVIDKTTSVYEEEVRREHTARKSSHTRQTAGKEQPLALLCEACETPRPSKDIDVVPGADSSTVLKLSCFPELELVYVKTAPVIALVSKFTKNGYLNSFG